MKKYIVDNKNLAVMGVSKNLATGNPSAFMFEKEYLIEFLNERGMTLSSVVKEFERSVEIKIEATEKYGEMWLSPQRLDVEFENTNGKTYKILDSRGDYTLLEDKKGGYDPFIVAWDLDIERGSWSKGRYYKTLDDAFDSFKELAK